MLLYSLLFQSKHVKRSAAKFQLVDLVGTVITGMMTITVYSQVINMHYN